MILETIFYSKNWIICRYWCTNIATVEPDKRVEIKPQNDPTQQCGTYRLGLLLIHQNPLYSFFCKYSYIPVYPAHSEVTTVGKRVAMISS